MNSDLSMTPREELETRLTALLLGELSPEETATLQAIIKIDPGLAAVYERLEVTMGLVREAAKVPAAQPASSLELLKLAEHRRQKLLVRFKTETPGQLQTAPRRKFSWFTLKRGHQTQEDTLKRGRRAVSWWVTAAAAAAVVLILGSMMLPALSRARFKAQRVSVTTALTDAEARAVFRETLGAPDQKLLTRIDQTASGVEPPRAPSEPGAKEGGTLFLKSGSAAKGAEALTVNRVAPVAPTAPLPPARSGGIVLPQQKESAPDVESKAWADFDNDGRLDSFVSVDSSKAPTGGEGTIAQTRRAAGRPTTTTFSVGASLARADGAHAAGPADKQVITGIVTGDGVPFPRQSEQAGRFVPAPTQIAGLGGGAGAGAYYGGGAYGGFSTVQRTPGPTAPPPPANQPKLGLVPSSEQVSPVPVVVAEESPAARFSMPVEAPVAVVPEVALARPAVVPASPPQPASVPTSTIVSSAGVPASVGQSSFFGVPALAGQHPVPDTASQVEARVPILGDVPVVGRLFRSELASEARDKSETVLGQTIVAENLRERALQEQLSAGTRVDDRNVALYSAQAELGKKTDAKGLEEARGAIAPEQEKLHLGSAAAAPAQKPALNEPAQVVETALAEIKEEDLARKKAVPPPVQIDGGALEQGKNAGNLLKQEADKSRAYEEAKRNLEQEQRLAELLSMKMASEGIDRELPKSGMVEVVDRAQPASVPSKNIGERLLGALTGKDAFASTARIKVERDQSDIPGVFAGKVGAYDPYFVQSELQAMQSDTLLKKVVEDLKLNEVWASKHGGEKLETSDTLRLLRNSLQVRSVPNTTLIEINVKSDRSEEAAQIANAIAEAYRAHRAEQRRQLAEGGIVALEEKWKEQDQRVRDAQKKVDELRLRAEQDPPLTPRPSPSSPVPQPEVQAIENPFSTFSLNVSDVSFKLAAASLEQGKLPDAGSIRSEEFINAFDYRDPEPAPGMPLAFASERARYPFAQNRDLVRFSVKTDAEGRQAGRPLNLVLLLDNSGSMERADRVRIIREALRVLATQLQPQDKLSVILFARTASLIADGVSGANAQAIAEQVSGITPEGGTNLGGALDAAYQIALRHYLPEGINRIVLLTDGAANLGDVEPESLKKMVETNRKRGIALDCFGIGWEGYNDDLLEVLSRNGDGRYGFINSPEQAATEFVSQLAGALQVAASDVKVQVEFNPARVTAYRQIGYAKHQLTKEQFRDNTVDAAEIGAAESGNALYVVEVNPQGQGPLATVRVRYKVPGTEDYHEHEWSVPYTGNAPALEQASPALRLAATASAFSEWLASSPYAADISLDKLIGLASGLSEAYSPDPRPGKLESMLRQAKSISGK